MRKILVTLSMVLAISMPSDAGAWGSQGHQLVGSVADGLLTDNARNHVQQALGMSLQTAAPWLDCVRSVKDLGGGKFKYMHDGFTPAACAVLETENGKKRMEDYAKSNWHQCFDADPGRACHAKYHFADEPIQDGEYVYGHAGTNDHDIVHAINAAIAKLEGRPVPKPFVIRDDTEALFMLAHLVGDLHQPLHVGAEYLDPDTGALLQPDAFPDKHTETQGGNLIQYTSSENLHGAWDNIPTSWGTDGASLLVQARALPVTGGNYSGWPQAWASDSVTVAKSTAFAGLAFGGQVEVKVKDRTQRMWPVSSRSADYSTVLRNTQRIQVIKGGRHLADLLNAIWP